MDIFESAVIYLVTFFSSILLFWVGQKLYNYGPKASFIRKIVFFIAVLIPCLLAGFRADSVGFDVSGYIIQGMHTATSSGIHSFTDCCKALDMAPEYLYMFLVYICSRITTDAGLLLFMIQFLTIGPIMLAALQMRKEISLALAMATYLFCFYNNTLNMMRQSVACAFILLGAAYLFQNKTKINVKVIVCFAVALFFHKSGIIGILSIFTLCKASTLKLKRWAYIAIYAAVILIPVLATPVFELLNSMELMSERFISYADIFLYKSGRQEWFVESSFSIGYIAMQLCWIGKIAVPCYYLRHYKYFDDSKITSIRSAAICGTLIYLIIFNTMNTIYGNRLSAYFDIFLVLLIPYAAQGKGQRQKTLILYLTVVVFWALCTMMLQWSGGTHIYEFRF